MAARATMTSDKHRRVSAGGRAAGPRTPSAQRRLLIVALSAVGVAVLVTITALLLWPRTTATHKRPAALPATSMVTAVTIDGQPVPLRELMLQVEAERAATFGYFQEHSHASGGAHFWNTRFGGTTPAEYLTAHAVADAVTVVVERQLALQHGLLRDAGYPAFLQSWSAENARRAKALAHHDVIYGPTQYSESGYFTYVMSDLVPRLEQALTADGRITVTEAEARAYYAAHPDQFAAGSGRASFLAVKEQAEQFCLDGKFQAYVAARAASATVIRADDVLSRVPLG